MTTPTEAAIEAMAQLREASNAYLDGAVGKGEAYECEDCLKQFVQTPKGLTIRKLGGLLIDEARFMPKGPADEVISVNFKVTWKEDVARLPKLEMEVQLEGEIKPARLTVRDHPWIAGMLGELIETPRLRLVKD
jgi:hypothetical protein